MKNSVCCEITNSKIVFPNISFLLDKKRSTDIIICGIFLPGLPRFQIRDQPL